MAKSKWLMHLITAGFEAIDVHMSDLVSGRQALNLLMPWPLVADLAMAMC